MSISLNTFRPSDEAFKAAKVSALAVSGAVAFGKVRDCLPIDSVISSVIPAAVKTMYNNLEECGPWQLLALSSFSAIGAGAVGLIGFVVAKKAVGVLGAVHHRLPNKPAWVKIPAWVAYPEFAKVKHDRRVAKFLPSMVVAAHPGMKTVYSAPASYLWYAPYLLTGGLLFNDRKEVENTPKALAAKKLA